VSGETDLQVMLERMRPVRRAGTYVFAVVPEDTAVPSHDVLASVREDEGVTLVLPQEAADRHGLGYDFVAAWITLDVHSALSAVGLTAAVSRALADEGISCNVLAGYYHDHLLVPAEKVVEAMLVLGASVEEAYTNHEPVYPTTTDPTLE
jgi:hypothetical protein